MNSGIWAQKPGWTGTTPIQQAFAALIPEDPCNREVLQHLVTALELVLTREQRMIPVLAVSCFGVKQVTGKTHREICELVHELSKKGHSIGYVSRLIKAGSVLSEYPGLIEMPDLVTRLAILRGAPRPLHKEIFTQGFVAGISIWTASREELLTAVAKLNHRASPDAQSKLPCCKELRGVTRALSRFVERVEEDQLHKKELGNLPLEAQKFLSMLCTLLSKQAA